MAQYSGLFKSIPITMVKDLPAGWKGTVKECQVQVKRKINGVEQEVKCGELIRCKNSATSGLSAHIEAAHAAVCTTPPRQRG